MADDDRPGRELVGVLVAFGRAVRAAGVPVGTGDLRVYSAAVAALDPADLGDLYWAGRASLVSRREDIEVYDRVFRQFFLDEPDDATVRRLPLKSPRQAREQLHSAVEVPATEPPAREEVQDRPAELGLVGSDIQILRTKAFADCTPDELAALRRLIASIRMVPPRRRTRRHVPARRGHHVDPRRTVRETLRRHGEPPPIPRRRRRRRRPRRLVLILDVSGSMADYSRNLLQFAYSTARAADRVEVFCFGTRLTRITRELGRYRRPQEALNRAAGAVFDWEGGTQIGACLDRFVRDWGRRGLSRGAIVVICSDGLDRGDPAVLAQAMARLERLCHAIVWMNPHRGADPDNIPASLGMLIAAPHIDLLLSGHDLASLLEFPTALARLG
ncbi:MAG: VWA domain-containing protein [Frankia sp.]|nr:VWA domain-containing protein [Frankia sp.]